MSVFVADLLDFFKILHENHFAHFGGSPLHDPCAVAVLTAPHIFSFHKARVEVECRAELTVGCTVVGFARGVSYGSNTVRLPLEEANVDVLSM